MKQIMENYDKTDDNRLEELCKKLRESAIPKTIEEFIKFHKFTLPVMWSKVDSKSTKSRVKNLTVVICREQSPPDLKNWNTTHAYTKPMPNYSDLDNEISCTVMIMRTFFYQRHFSTHAMTTQSFELDDLVVVDYVPGIGRSWPAQIMYVHKNNRYTVSCSIRITHHRTIFLTSVVKGLYSESGENA